jgi:putative acetyltransferase
MYAAPDVRRQGVAVEVIRALEAWALARGVTELRLETGDRLLAAQRFYEREGYEAIPRFGPYVGSDLSRCYRRRLV